MPVDRHSYLGRDDLKRSLGSTLSNEDAALRRILEGVSEQIDLWVDRRFQPYQASRVFTGRRLDSISLDDVTEVTAVRFDQDGDRVYEVLLSTSDWELGPPNAANDRAPYEWLDMQPNGSYLMDRSRRGVQITGVWGYCDQRVQIGAALSTTLDATSTSFVVTAAGVIQPQHTIRIGDEQLYVTDATTAAVVSVERAVNGSSAAAHATTDAIQLYRYPAPVVEACRVQSLRLHKRKDAPLGVLAGGLDVTEGIVQVIRLDPDVEKLLEPYRKYRFFAL